MFKQAKQNRVFEDVIHQVQEAILQGNLKEGDKLPSERKLIEIFKVSRGTLREALRALEQKGLIKIRTGVQGGAIVYPVDTKLMSDSLELLLRYQKISLKELAEFREEVEGLVAVKAAKKIKKEDIKQLSLFLKLIKNQLDSNEFNWAEVVREDNKFHYSLARIAGNRVFQSVLHTVYENIYPYFDQFLSKDRRLMEKNYRDLCRILEALKVKDPKKAQMLVQEHVRYFNRMMEDGEKRNMPIAQKWRAETPKRGILNEGE